MGGKRIPPEIWAETFLCVVESCADGFPKLHPNQAPLLLTQVCRAWRDIALTTRHLWTHLDIPRTDDDRFIPILHKYISLSSPLPLTFTVDLFSGEPTSAIIEFMYVGVLCIHSERWKDVQFRLRHDTSVEALTSHISSKFRVADRPDFSSLQPMLEAFELEVPYAAHDKAIFEVKDDAAPHVLFLSGLKSCSRLRSLTIINWIPLLTFPQNALPTTLHHLSVRYLLEHPLYPEKVTCWLRNLPSLSSLDFNIPHLTTVWMTDDWPYNPPRPETLDYSFPAIRSLSIAATDHVAMNYLLSHLPVPNLHSLRLTVINDWSSPAAFIETCRYLLKQCASSLETLELCGYQRGLSDEELVMSITKRIPGLKSLVIRRARCIYEPVYEEIFQFLTIDASDGPDGRPLSAANCELERIYFDTWLLPPSPMFRNALEDGLLPYHIERFEDLFIAMADMVLSRSVDGPKARRVSLELGPIIMKVYKECYPEWKASTQERWEMVTGTVWEAQDSTPWSSVLEGKRLHSPYALTVRYIRREGNRLLIYPPCNSLHRPIR